MYGLGVDIGGTAIKLGLFTEQGDVVDKWQIKSRKDEGGSHVLSDVAASMEERFRAKGVRRDEVLGVGVGVPGAVMADGTVLKCANLGWGVCSPAKEFEELTGIANVKIVNDANAAALGEVWKGGGRGYKSIVMVTLGTGVGGAILIDGKVVTGSKGAAGEIGHITVENEEEETCGCGNKGCLEQYVSATGVMRLAKRMLLARSTLVENGTPSRLTEGELSAKAVFDAAKAGDGLAGEVVERFGEYLGMSLSNVAGVVDPEAFVIGGGVSKAGDILIRTVEKYYNQYAMYALKGRDFKLAQLGNDAGIYGTVKMVLSDV